MRTAARLHGPALRLVVAVVAVGLVAACRAPAQAPASPTGIASPAPAAGASQTVEVGPVSAVATWAGPGAGPVFEIALETHSVDLDGVDLADATLVNDRGDSLAARPWEAPPGGHHRAGRLAFEGDAASFFGGSRTITLTLDRIGAPGSATFSWPIPPGG